MVPAAAPIPAPNRAPAAGLCPVPAAMAAPEPAPIPAPYRVPQAVVVNRRIAASKKARFMAPSFSTEPELEDDGPWTPVMLPEGHPVPCPSFYIPIRCW